MEFWGMSSQAQPPEHPAAIVSSLESSEAFLPFYPSYPRCPLLAKDRANAHSMGEYGYVC